MRRTERRLADHALPGARPVFLERGDARAQDAFGRNAQRLRSIKHKYDPDGVFTATPIP